MKTLHETQLERFDEEFAKLYNAEVKYKDCVKDFDYEKLKSFVTQCRKQQLVKDIEEMKKIMDSWTRELGTDKHNGQMEYLLEQKQKELESVEKLLLSSMKE